MHIDDTLNKLKVKRVVKDFSQMYDVNFTNTFASTVKFDTLRLFLVFVALKNLKCHQVDVNNAFIELFLNEIIYMHASLDVDLSSDQCLLIRRSLYDLKQAARDWHKRCIKKLLKLDFEQCVANSCMLRHKEKDIILLIYVDDICIAVKTLQQIQ